MSPRPRLSDEERSARHAERHNQRQRNRLPLYMQSGLEAELQATGLINDRQPLDLLRANAAYFNHLEQARQAAADHARLNQHACKTMLPDSYRERLLHLRTMQQRFASMRDPAMRADYWLTALRRGLDHQTFLYVLDLIFPEHAETLRQKDRWEASWASKQAKGEYNSWTPQNGRPA